MNKFFKTKGQYHSQLQNSLIVVLLILLTGVLFLVINRRSEPMHRGAQTFTVCHAVQGRGRGERYFCSNDGCYSTKKEEMTVIGSYEDGNTCAGIATNLGK